MQYIRFHWRRGVRSGSMGGVSSADSALLACHRLYINTIMTQMLIINTELRAKGGKGGRVQETEI